MNIEAEAQESIFAPITRLPEPKGEVALKRANNVLAAVHDFTIDSPTMRALAVEETQGILARRNVMEAERVSFTQPLNEVLRALNAKYKPAIEVMEAAANVLKGKMIAFDDEQERIAAAAQAEAERKEALERQRLQDEADRVAREAQEKADQLAAQAQAAEAAGDQQAAAEARAAQAEVQDQAVAEVAALETTAAVVSVPAVFVAPSKVKGSSTAKSLDYEITDMAALIRDIASRLEAEPGLAQLLTVDSVRMRNYVKGLGTETRLAGVSVGEKKTMRIAKAA